MLKNPLFNFKKINHFNAYYIDELNRLKFLIKSLRNLNELLDFENIVLQNTINEAS